ncbi:hypothetical protein A5761_11210 [Mycolicibacterium setense]|uniref:hypothetical protein n=1 Tax=Mycolicibacterium setense TaxID=431269 RepID=UPI0007EB067B|nr:hypothetical protein [Mycolicibacterium setense]OBB17018.1 hypothetical protein A5761_11210 [Mycolicibacterium setense]
MDIAPPRRNDSRVNTDEVTAFLRQAGLDPQHWDIGEITRKVHRWVTDHLIELGAMEPTWSDADKAAHHAEFGSVAAVDFLEQCVIEAGPDSAPWRELQQRVDTGEFDEWQPIWHHVPDNGHKLGIGSPDSVQTRGSLRDGARTPLDERLLRAQQRVNALHRGCTGHSRLIVDLA